MVGGYGCLDFHALKNLLLRQTNCPVLCIVRRRPNDPVTSKASAISTDIFRPALAELNSTMNTPTPQYICPSLQPKLQFRMRE